MRVRVKRAILINRMRKERMTRWLLAVILSMTTLSGYPQVVSIESPTTRVNLLELFTSEG